MTFKTLIPLEPHHFYNFDPLHVLMFKSSYGRRLFNLHPMNVQCMFKIFQLERKGKFCGLAFQSPFQIINNGAYLATFMQKTRMQASNHQLLIRTDDVVVYTFPNVGALAISPKLNPRLQTMFDEQ